MDHAAGPATKGPDPMLARQPPSEASSPRRALGPPRSASIPNLASRASSSLAPGHRRMSSVASSSSLRSLDKLGQSPAGKRFEVMAKFLHQRLAQNKWLDEYQENMPSGAADLGAFVKRGDGTYAKTTTSYPVLVAVERICPPVAFTMYTELVSAVLETLDDECVAIPLLDGTSLHVVNSIEAIVDAGSFARYGSCAILCRIEQFILVCASSLPDLIKLGHTLEARMLSLIWGTHGAVDAVRTTTTGLRTDFSRRSQSANNFMFDSLGSELPELHSPRAVHFEETPRSKSLASIDSANAYGSQSPRTRSIGYTRKNSTSSIKSFSRPFTQHEPHSSHLMPSTPQPTRPRPSHLRNTTGGRIPPRSLSVDSFAPHKEARRGSVFFPMETDRRDTVTSLGAQHLPPSPERKISIFDRPMDKKQSEVSVTEFPGSMSRGGSFAHSRANSSPEEVEKMVQFVQTAMYNEENADEGIRQRDQPRKFMLNHAVLVSIVITFVIALQLWTTATLLKESRLDGSYWRWLLVLTIPVFAVFSFFFLIVITSSVFQLFAPISFVTQNSAYYSAKAPKYSEHEGEPLPHITIQMPVYKEGLKGVIMPTINSLLQAVAYYERYGGTATIFVCDDGMQLITEELQEARKIFYAMHDIAWVSRPKQCTKPGPDFFLRKGKFKKASNMNYGLEFAGRVEDEFLRLMEERAKEQMCSEDELTVEDEDELFDLARENMRLEDGGRTWCAGDLRMGEFILLIDSDTQVPENCLLCGALEMMESPEVAVLQHSSGVMNMTHSAFENGIHYFTDLVYTSIAYSVAAGDCAPFVGHNAFLRWKALQTIAYMEDGKTKYWSEAHVSEDFDVSLRLQMQHFTVRMGGYHNNEFKEGVSLTIYDELARWEKYAYGCNELIFHPLIYWPTKGPITPLFRRFIKSNIKITSKFTIMAYIGTYYAIAVGFPLTVANYFICGWSVQLDHYYQPSWRIWVGLAVVYSCLSPVSFAMLRHRIGQRTFPLAILDAAKWTPFFFLFFGGLSYHVSKALLCHFFSVQIEWTTTAKELEKTGLRIGLDRVFRDFWKMYCFIIPLVGAMVYLGVYAPFDYKITNYTIIIPMSIQIVCHSLLPFALGLF